MTCRWLTSQHVPHPPRLPLCAGGLPWLLYKKGILAYLRRCPGHRASLLDTVAAVPLPIGLDQGLQHEVGGQCRVVPASVTWARQFWERGCDSPPWGMTNSRG